MSHQHVVKLPCEDLLNVITPSFVSRRNYFTMSFYGTHAVFVAGFQVASLHWLWRVGLRTYLQLLPLKFRTFLVFLHFFNRKF